MKKRFSKNLWKRTTALSMAAILAAGSWNPLIVNAQHVNGTAPFINSWLVAGPFESPVADDIYGTEIPYNPNLSKQAAASASSATLSSNPPEVQRFPVGHSWNGMNQLRQAVLGSHCGMTDVIETNGMI